MPPIIDEDKCTACGVCAAACPGDIIHINSEKNIPMVLYPDECCHCGNCRISCEIDAIKIVLPLSMLV